MFCNQCQETAKNVGCTINGVCGKGNNLSDLQDLMIFACQSLSFATIEARKKMIDTNVESRHIMKCLFMTITNANFDEKAIFRAIEQCFSYRDSLKKQFQTNALHHALHWTAANELDYHQ